MKNFFGRYSYSTVKMFVTQLVISLFGVGLAMATASTANDTLTVIVSCFAILFYLYLIYAALWEVGAKDKISVDVGKKAYKPFTGLVMGILANIPNFIIAIAYTVAYPFMENAKWAGTMAVISRFASIITQGMYLGCISSIKVAGKTLNNFWQTYFIITVPSIVVSFAAYYLGHKNFRFFSFGAKKENKD